jgi:hypothetical protein
MSLHSDMRNGIEVFQATTEEDVVAYDSVFTALAANRTEGEIHTRLAYGCRKEKFTDWQLFVVFWLDIRER